MRNSRWILNESKLIDKHDNINPDLIKILAGREITSQAEVRDFISPSLEKLGNPLGLCDLQVGIQRVDDALKNGETIWIYGDYDVDGITSTTLFYRALTALGGKVRYYIPLRDEGYGLNCEALSWIAKEGGTLVITVDCGITSHVEAEHAKNLGIDLIITDHHDIIDSRIPKAFAVINPKRIENTYTFKYLAGVGVAFMFLLALYDSRGMKGSMYSYLDIVAIGTVADIVSLRGDNRIFVAFGLKKLNTTSSEGLRSLLRRLFPEDFSTRKYSPYDIGFIIAPVFNAAGRLEDAKKSVELLISHDNTVYSKLIDELVSNNFLRKEIQENILEQVSKQIAEKKLDEKSLILVGDTKFHHGVIGIVASKVLDRFYKPTIILEIDNDTGIAKASCRSTEAFNMIDGLTKFSHYLLKFGGHHGAAGFSIKTENLDKFYEEFEKYCSQVLTSKDTLKPIKISENIPAYKIGFNLIDNLVLLEPYGFDNPTPIFSMKNCKVVDIKAIGKEKTHLSLTISSENITLRNCVWWNSADLFNEMLLRQGENIDIAFKLKLETYREKFQYKLFIEDIQFSEENKNFNPEVLNLEMPTFPIKSVIYSAQKPHDNFFKIKFSQDSGIVYQNRTTIGFLDSTLTELLKLYSSELNSNFCGKITEIKETIENFNIFISIYQDFSFKTYAIKDSQLFQEIREFLKGNSEYTPFEKKVLGATFKNNINFEISVEKYSKEIENIFSTIALYFYSKKFKVLTVTDEPVSALLSFYSDISDKFVEGYDFYIFLNSEITAHSVPKKYLSVTTENR